MNTVSKIQKDKQHDIERRFDVDALIRKINQTIEDKKLYKEVHKFQSGKCIRNYLDCNGLLTKYQIMDEISQVFLNAICTGNFATVPIEIPEKQYALVGVANSGAEIAAHISSISGIPMLYYVPPYKTKKFTEPETELVSYAEMLDRKKVVLIIGVNHTGSAIRAATKFIYEMVKIHGKSIQLYSILGVINRDINSGEAITKLKEQGINVQFLLNDYPIEWCSINENGLPCPYGEKCHAQEEE